MAFLKKYGVIILGVIIGMIWGAVEGDMLPIKDNTELDPITFASYEKGYEVTAPGDWTRLSEDDAGETTLLLESPKNAAAFLIYEELKADYSLTAEEYYNAVVNMTAYELNRLPEEKIEFKDVEPIVINGNKAKACEFNFTDDSGLNMRFWLHFFETDDAYVRVICSTKVSEFENYRPILQKIAESIVVK